MHFSAGGPGGKKGEKFVTTYGSSFRALLDVNNSIKKVNFFSNRLYSEWTQKLKLIILSHVLTKVTLVYANVFKTSRYIENPIKNFFFFCVFLLFASQ